ncbi:hypothetical protein DBT_1155 [Dissulfuribacter thermophilus]|uniref:Uncharacterized protein n=1 Tax=Dissulfuribacter thermophilus TaxID=1156395 RepID=A0A1B9F632_9BACT|nr:hypothetical protein DBT_1155 [Dissulfuribacter thermophilus]
MEVHYIDMLGFSYFRESIKKSMQRPGIQSVIITCNYKISGVFQ